MSKDCKKEPLLIFAIQGGLLTILGITKPLSALNWLIGDIGFAIVLIYQMYLPAIINQLQNYTPIVIFKGFTQENYKKLILVSLITLPLYVFIYCLTQKYIYKIYPINLEINLTLFSHLIYSFIVNLFLIALPEEYYYRGFLQKRLQNIYNINIAIILTATFFALGHYVGSFNISRLATFFPSLLFSFLAYKTDSIFSAVLYHAICNLIAEVMYIIYHGI